jgi:hypothetical protein
VFDAGGISAAEITFAHLSAFFVKGDGAKGTSQHTQSAANAYCGAYQQGKRSAVPVNRIGRTYILAVCLFTLLANHRNVNALFLEIDDLNSGLGRIKRSFMKKSTVDLAIPTARTFFVIYHQ